MKLIDKEKVETILRNLWKKDDDYKSEHRICYNKALQEVQCEIDTLETKEVDLDKEIKNGIDNLSNLYCYMEDLFNGNEEEGVYPIPEKVKNELFEFAKHFFELGLKTQKGE
jgi:hypothetical protein